MNWKEEMRLWSQDLYMSCLADQNLPRKNPGSDQLRQAVGTYSVFEASELAPPTLRSHPTRDTTKLTLGDPDYRKALQRLQRRLARRLILDLDILQDSALQHLVQSQGGATTGGVESYINQIGVDLSKLPWAHHRSIELSAVRNCITHNQDVWQQAQVNRLEALSWSYPIPIVGSKIEFELPHLFAYKTAVKTVLSQCEKHIRQRLKAQESTKQEPVKQKPKRARQPNPK